MTLRTRSLSLISSIQHVLKDVLRVSKGFYAIVRHVISKDQVELSLSLFSTPSQVVKPGHHCTYAINICNISNQGAWVKLLFDIHLKEHLSHLDGHHSYFEKAIFVRAQESQNLHITYDWKEDAVIGIDDLSFEPDLFWSGGCETKGKYCVKALLLDERGKAFDELSLVQNLSE